VDDDLQDEIDSVHAGGERSGRERQGRRECTGFRRSYPVSLCDSRRTVW
jgi:hypothetical protein